MVWFFSDTFIWRAEGASFLKGEGSAGQTSVSGVSFSALLNQKDWTKGVEKGRPFFLGPLCSNSRKEVKQRDHCH